MQLSVEWEGIEHDYSFAISSRRPRSTGLRQIKANSCPKIAKASWTVTVDELSSVWDTSTGTIDC
jgi:hypothetical protein